MNQAKEYIVKVARPDLVDDLIAELTSWNVKVSDISKVGFVGFSAKMGTLLAKKYKDDPRIVKLESSSQYELQFIQNTTSDSLWHLDRIDQINLPLSGSYSYSNQGTDVTFYTVDSGVSFDHVELANKVDAVLDPNFPSLVFDPVVDYRIYEQSTDYNESFRRGTDELGHGTFIAGLLVSNTYGVAKGATVRSAKVFGQSAVTSGRILAGLNAVAQDYIGRNKPVSVLNLSIASFAEATVITSLYRTETPNSSFIINSSNIELVDGTVDEIINQLTILNIDGLIALNIDGKLQIQLTKLGSITLVDGNNSPLAALGITPGTYQNIPNLVEQAIIDLVNDGMHVVISAGNYGTDAALMSPARIGAVSDVIVVGATDRNDNLGDFTNAADNESTLDVSTFSNINNANAVGSCFGPVVDLYAPGVNVESTWLNSYNTSGQLYNESLVSSGTSFAAPLVAGAIALALETSAISPSDMKDIIIAGAAENVINGLPSGSNNRLLNITEIDSSIIWTQVGPYLNLPLYSYQELFFSATSYMGLINQYSIVDGILPVGLSFDSINGRIYGVIAGSNAIGDYQITIKAHNGLNDDPMDTTGNIDLIISIVTGVVPAHWNTPVDLGKIREGDSLNIVLSADNIAAPSNPVTYAVVGNLPYGWVLVGNQIIGTAPIATNGDFETGFTIDANDGFTNTPRSFKIIIEQIKSYAPDNEPVWLTPTGILGTFPEGANVSIQLQAVDSPVDPLPLTYNLSVTDGDGSSFGPVGQLPPGLTLNSATGVISGQVPVIADDTQSYEFAIYLSDGANVVVNLFAIILIKQQSTSQVIWDTPAGNLGSFFENDIVNITLQAHDSIGMTVNYLFASGQLPNGLTMNANGVISGTIQDNIDQLNVFTILASNGFNATPATFSILNNKINSAPVWNSDDLGSWPEGSFVNIPLPAYDPDGDQLVFSSTDLPQGLYIQESYLRGTLGAVDEDTTITFTITASDSPSNPVGALQASQQFSLIITDGALNPNSPPIWLTPEGPLQSGITTQFYSTSLIAVDPENDPLSYSLIEGSLPPGLVLDQINGTITGTIGLIAQDAGYDFTIMVSDGVFQVSRSFNIFVSSAQTNQPPIWVTPSNLGSIVDGQPSTIQFVATDPEGTAITYSYISGSLPPGMLFNNTTGQLSGVPSIVNDNSIYQFIIRATDFSLDFADQQFTITVVKTPNVAPIWITPSGQLSNSNGLIEYHPGEAVNFQFQAIDPDNGPLELTYRLSYNSSLPYGLSISSSGLLSGYVGEVYSTQELGFTVEILDGSAVVPRNFIIKFVPTPAYTGTMCDLYVPLSVELKQMLRSWNVDELIPDADLYLPDDPAYGRPNEYDVFVTNNIHTDDKNEIQLILGEHHKRFSSLMGIPTYATGKDNFGNPIYEVIYIPLIDPQTGSEYNIPSDGDIDYYSHSFDNIRREVRQLENSELLPSWMRVSQDSEGTILGYVPAIILAYVQPGKAKSVIQTFTQIINQTNFNIQETTFDRHVLLSEKVNPTVTPGSQLSVEGVLVTFTGSDILTAKNDIETALFNAGLNTVRVYLEDSVQYQYIGNVFTPVFGYALRFNYSKNYITLTNISGTPCEELGFKSGENIETTFDGQLVHFDYSLILDEKQNIQADGLTFAGTELLFDRYIGHLSTGQRFQVKWAPEYQERYYDSHKKEFWSKNPPVWVTPPGELGFITTELPVTIQLRTKHHLVDQIVKYELVFGSLPPGFTLNSDTGVITGVAGQEGETTFFTVRAFDKWGNYKDRGFTMSTGANILRIKQFIILINGQGIKV